LTIPLQHSILIQFYQERCCNADFREQTTNWIIDQFFGYLNPPENMSKKVDFWKKQVFEQLFEPENMSKKLIS
jgi:hypothetical protein